MTSSWAENIRKMDMTTTVRHHRSRRSRHRLRQAAPLPTPPSKCHSPRRCETGKVSHNRFKLCRDCLLGYSVGSNLKSLTRSLIAPCSNGSELICSTRPPKMLRISRHEMHLVSCKCIEMRLRPEPRWGSSLQRSTRPASWPAFVVLLAEIV